MRRLTRRAAREDGAISVMAAALALAMLLSTALAVDVGRVAYVSRDQQGVADRAAMDAIRVIKASTADTLAELYGEVVDAVDQSLDRNPGSSGTAEGRTVDQLHIGRVQDGTFASICGSRDDCASADAAGTWGPGDVSAVHVTVDSVVRFLFAIGAPTADGSDIVGRRVAKVAEAVIGDPRGAVSAATSLVDLDDGVARTLLRRLLGAEVELSLVGWNGLLQTDVRLRDIAAQVGAGSPSELLDVELTVNELADVLVTILSADSDLSAEVETTLAELASTTLGVGLGPVRLGDLLVIDPSAGGSALDATVDAAGLLLGFAQVANHANAVSIDLDVAGTPITVRIVEPPQIAIGRPGKDAGGNWFTQASTAQLRVDAGLPLSFASATVARSGSYSAALFRDRIDAISGCLEAVNQASDAAGTIRSDIEDAADAFEEAAGLLGLVVDALVATIDSLLGTLDALVATVSCLLTPNSTRDAIKSDLHELVDAYENLVAAVVSALDDDVAGVPVADTPVLRVMLASGSVALDAIDCSDPLGADTHIEGQAGQVLLTSASRIASNPEDPGHQTATLLDLDLQVIGEVRATLSGDVSLGSFEDEHTFVGPFASDSETFSSGTLGLGSVLEQLTLTVTPAEALGLPASRVVDPAVASLSAALGAATSGVDTALARIRNVLGVDLGSVEARVLGARCEGPPRLLPRQMD
jgi:uncharacterized membrane protein